MIDDSFFDVMNDPYLKGNKEGNRPHYYCYMDSNGIIWMIPLSSKIAKYQSIIDKRLALGKPCDTLHIAKLDNGKESVFLIRIFFL